MLMIHIIFIINIQMDGAIQGFTLGNPFIDFKNNNPSKVMHLGMKRILDDKYNFKFLLSRNT